jgi:hypothetical protein
MNAPYRHPTPSPQLRTEYNNVLYNQLVDDLCLLSSYVNSATESAWRGNGWMLGEYKNQIRAGVIEIINKYKKLDLCQSEADWRKRCNAEQTERLAAERNAEQRLAAERVSQ